MLVAILISNMGFFKNRVIKSVGFLSKAKQWEKIHKNKFQKIKYISTVFFVRKNVWQKYCLAEKMAILNFIIL